MTSEGLKKVSCLLLKTTYRSSETWKRCQVWVQGRSICVEGCGITELLAILIRVLEDPSGRPMTKPSRFWWVFGAFADDLGRIHVDLHGQRAVTVPG